MRPAATPRRRRALIIGLAGAALLVLALAPAAFGDALTPESRGGSPNAESIDTLYKIVLAIGALMFLLVEGVLIYSIVKFRYRRSRPEPVMIRGNATLEIGWTVGAAVIVMAIAALTFVFLPGIKNPKNSLRGGLASEAGVKFASVSQPQPPNGRSLRVNVVGQQYIWRFDYVTEKPLTDGRPMFAYQSMVVPVNTTVTLKINSADVDHSWWIPDLGGKADAVPGHDNYTWFRISKPGVYRGACAELCGNNHADMRARVHAVTVDQYRSWVQQQRSELLQSQTELAKARKQGYGQ